MKKIVLSLILFVSCLTILSAQEKGYQDAVFPGGKEGWLKYVETNLNVSLGKYIPNPKGLEKVQQSAYVSFKVDTSGSITDVVVTNADSLHPKLVEEAIRVIKGSPKWKPAMSNGGFVTSKGIQTITWQHGKGKSWKSNANTENDLSASKWFDVKKRDTTASIDTSKNNSLAELNHNNDSTYKSKVVQVEASFPGGSKEWTKYLGRNMDASLSRYIPIPEDEASAKQTAIVDFKIDEEGNVVEVSVVNAAEINPNLTREARRVITASPKWIPATINGKPVYYRGRQMLSWVRNR